MSAYPDDCPQWQCPHLSQHDAREGRVCLECPPCTCGLVTLRDAIVPAPSAFQQEVLGEWVASEPRLVPQWVEDAARKAMEPGPLTRYLLRHQHQEYTDTTAAYHRGEDVVPGDCWRACLASLLEIPLAEVPHFAHLYPDPGLRWWEETVAWVREQRPGWTLGVWKWTGDADRAQFPIYRGDDAKAAPDRVILTAPSPRGDWNHSVLIRADDGELEHDPMPGGTGVLDGEGDLIGLVRIEWQES